MKNYLKAVMVFLFAVVAVSGIVYLFQVAKPTTKDDEEEVLQADVEIRAFIRMQEIVFRVHPEKRHPDLHHWSTYADFTIENPSDGSTVYHWDAVLTDHTNGDGRIELDPTEVVNSGVYNILIKGRSHLSKRYEGIVLEDISETLDFTPYGDILAGDTHNSRDDFINSLDISTLIIQLGTGNYVCDLNQDSQVNSLDLSNQVYNIGKAGDTL
ncbi:hypothetical protein JW710_01145 [Candidatus Dojkabacteria bacterium]|nr:hypothetical protein [Candidatus Dojkabacteria bacterium]